MRRLTQWLGGMLTGLGAATAASGLAFYAWSWYSQQQAQQDWLATLEAPRTATVAALPPASQRVAARLFFPRLDARRFVMNGATKAKLAGGPGWLRETAPPGSRGNCVIAGHRDTHFGILRDLREGDRVEVEYWGQTYSYEVTRIAIVDPSDVALLEPEQEPVLTLVTCYPFSYVGRAPRRYIARAELTGRTAANARMTDTKHGGYQ